MALTPASVYHGFPASEGHDPDKDDIVALLMSIQTLAAGGAFAAVDVNLADLPDGTTSGDLGLVLSDASDGGLYEWDGSAWVFVGALPFILGGETYALIAKAWAESPTPPDPDDATSKSSKTWAGEATTQAGIAEAWAESPTPPDPDDATSKSAKTWAGEAQATAETLADLTTLEGLVTDAQTAESNAEGFATQAETARDATVLAAAAEGVYADATLAAAITTGLAAVADGGSFYATGDDVDYIGLYEDNAGSEVELARLGKQAAIAAVAQSLATHEAATDNPHDTKLVQVTPPGVLHVQQTSAPIPSGFFYNGDVAPGLRYIGTEPMPMDVVVLIGQSLNVSGYATVQQFYAGDGAAYMLNAGVNTRRWPYQAALGASNSVDAAPSWAETQGIVALDEGDWQSPAAGIANTLLQTSAHRALFFSNARGSLDIRSIWRSGMAATLGGVIFTLCDQVRAMGFGPRVSFYLAHGEQDGRISTTEADYLAWVQTYFDKCRYYAQIGMLDPTYVAPIFYTLPTQTNSPNYAPAGDDKPIYRALAQLSGAVADCHDLGAIYDMGVQKDLVHPTPEGYVLRGERVGDALRTLNGGTTPDAPLRMTGVVLDGTSFTITLNHSAVRDVSIGTGLDLNGTDGFEWWDDAASAFIAITGLTYSGTTITGTLASAPTGTVGQNELRYGLQTTVITSFEKPEGEKPGGVVRRDHAGWTSVFDPTFTHRSWLCNDFIIPTEAA